MRAVDPDNEQGRLAALQSLEILDTSPEQIFDDVALLAAHICEVPIALVSFVDAERQWFKSRVGLDVSETSRDDSFCAHAILQEEVMVVPDTHDDERFAANPLVTGDPMIRFYAGAPLITDDGMALGTICVIDRVPRRLSDEQNAALTSLARLATAQLARRRSANALQESEARFAAFMDNLSAVAYMKDPDGRYVYANRTLRARFDGADVVGLLDSEWLPPTAAAEVRVIDARVRETGAPVTSIELVATPDGEQREWLTLKFPFPSAGSVYVGGISFDITEQRRSEERLRSIIAEAKDAFISFDLRGAITEWNAAAERIFGLPREDALGRSLEETIVPPDLRDAYRTAIRRVASGEEPWDESAVERTALRSDGTVVPVEITIWRTEQEPERVNAFVRDITERTRARDELRASREALADFIESAHDLIQSVGPDGAVLEANAAWREALGYSVDEVAGLPMTRFIHPGSLPHCLEVFQEITENGEGGRVEAVFLTKDGRELNVEGSVNARIEDGRAVSTRGIFRDVTERRRAEDALARSESRARAEAARFSAVLEAATEYSIIGTDTDGLIEVFNKGAERMLGYAADDVVLVHTPAVLHVPDEVVARAAELGIEPGFEVFVAAARRGGPETREWTYVRRDGSHVPVALTVTAMRDSDGELRGFIGVAEDITERKRAEAERERLLEAERAAAQALAEQNARLEELDALKDEFVSVVSHELRTPLTSILGWVEILRGEEPGPLNEEQAHFLGIVARNAERLLRVVSDLLFVSKVDSGTLTLDLGRADLQRVAADVVEGAQPFARQNDVALELDADGALEVDGDVGRLNQLLDNLVTNAVKFTPAGGTVRVRAAAEDDSVVLEVSDSGIGIAADELDRLFERFFRASTAVDRAIPGTGLGLTIVKAIAEAHGGRITVQSEPGSGTTFRVQLPAGQLEPVA